MPTYHSTIEVDSNGEFFLTLPDELFTGDNKWLADDILVWEVLDQNEIRLVNKSLELRNKQHNSTQI